MSMANPLSGALMSVRPGADISRFTISTRDDGDPALTFRSIILGSVFAALSSVINMLYFFKPIQIGVSAVFVQLFVFLFGEAWALLTPNPDRFAPRPESPDHPDRFGLKKLQIFLVIFLKFLNFGQPFGIKEHVVASLLATSSGNGLSGIEIYAVEKLFYNHTVTATLAVLGTFSISLCGFVLAGVLRPLIVYPAEMVYWGSLPQVVLFQRLHHDRTANKERLTKFGWAFGASAIWEFFPAYIIPWSNGLSVFCLGSINASSNVRSVFTKVFGGASNNEGMGIFNFGLDWQYIQSTSMSFPLKLQLNSWIGYAIGYAGMIGLYYSNVWNAKTFPFMSAALFQSNGSRFSASAVMNSQGTIDFDKLNAIGVPSLSSSTIWGYFTANLAIGALISHVTIFFSKDLVKTWKQSREKTQPDPHYRAMEKYDEVPMWWYLILFGLAFVAGLVVTIMPGTTLPAWGFIIALLLGAFIAPFSCVLYALYGNGIATNQLSKMVAGAILPGRPLANLYFASWSHQVIGLAVYLATNLKIGQYTKIPHRIMFLTQIYGTLLGAALNYVVMTVIVTNKREILLDSKGDAVWSGSAVQSLNSQAVTWALARQVYSISGQYLIVPLGLIIGLGLPVLQVALHRVYPASRKWELNTSIIASNAEHMVFHRGGCRLPALAQKAETAFLQQGTSSFPPGYVCQRVLHKKSNGIIRKRLKQLGNFGASRWRLTFTVLTRGQYNYLIGAAMDGGAQIVIFVLSFAVYGANGKEVKFPTYFGNPAGNPDHCNSDD
ncbi:Oligopeptide transporter [Lachnellula suecica]|uniref:Oligopeptide transporter n=1 Tax=Lachnellula suecica TaxID=602035 RepID=A0A8T9CJX4_9HELO|nr:Oligopeptide transporter [Lachnellula suecica]